MDTRQKVFVATPMYGGMCTGFYTLSMLETQTALTNRGISFQFGFVMNEALITRGRNWLVHEFLRTDCTHLLFIDADIRWSGADIPTLLDADKEIICGLYPAKEINWSQVEAAVKRGVTGHDLRAYTAHFVINVKATGNSPKDLPLDQPFEIIAGGTGMMLIRREVFEKLKPHVLAYRNNVMNLSRGSGSDDLIYEFFSTRIEPEAKNLLSEDYFFCDLWRKLGGRIWAAPWMRLSHQGTYIFEGRPG